MNYELRIMPKQGVTRDGEPPATNDSKWCTFWGWRAAGPLLLKKILILTSAFVMLFYFLIPPSGHAQTAVGLGIYPPIYTITTTPPSNIHQPLVIKNFTDDNLTVTIQL